LTENSPTQAKVRLEWATPTRISRFGKYLVNPPNPHNSPYPADSVAKTKFEIMSYLPPSDLGGWPILVAFFATRVDPLAPEQPHSRLCLIEASNVPTLNFAKAGGPF
jgi:hypothetical protein